MLFNAIRMMAMLLCLGFTLPAYAQLKSDKTQDKREKTDKNKKSKKEKLEVETSTDEKNAPDEANTETSESKDEQTDTKTSELEEKNAQSIKVKLAFSEEFTNERGGTMMSGFLKDMSGQIHLIRTSSGGWFAKAKTYISGYNADMKELYDNELDLGMVGADKLYYSQALTIGERPYIIAESYNESTEKHTIYAIFLDKGGKLGNPQKLCQWEGGHQEDGNYELVLSRDKHKLLVFNILPIEKGEDKINVAFSVLDKDLNKLWSGKSKFSSEGKGNLLTGKRQSTKFRNLVVDNSSRVFVLVETEREDKKSNESTAITDLYQFMADDTEPIKYNLDLVGKDIDNLALIETSNPDELIGGGSYSTNKKSGWFGANRGSLGTFMFRLNVKTNEVKQKTIKPFSTSITNFMRLSEKDKSKSKGVIGLQLIWSYLTPNDNLVLALEQNYTVTKHSQGGMSVSHFSQVMLNIKYDKEGNVLYQTFVPKSIVSSGGTYSKMGMSHILTPQGERHALIFNDHRKNIEKKINTSQDMATANILNMNGIVARFVNVDEQGRRKNSILFAGKDEDYILLPNVFLNYKPNTLITVGVYLAPFQALGKKFKLIKIEY